MSIEKHIEMAVRLGSEVLVQRLAEREQRELRDREDYERHLAEKWLPIVTAVKLATPAWAHECMAWPKDEEPEYCYGSYSSRETLCRPVTFLLPGCTSIEAFIDNGSVYFRAVTPRLEKGEDGWSVAFWSALPQEWEIEWMETDFAVIVHTAHENTALIAGLAQEAVRRNEPKTPAAEKPLTPIDLLRHYAEMAALEGKLPISGPVGALREAQEWAIVIQAEALHDIAWNVANRP